MWFPSDSQVSWKHLWSRISSACIRGKKTDSCKTLRMSWTKTLSMPSECSARWAPEVCSKSVMQKYPQWILNKCHVERGRHVILERAKQKAHVFKEFISWRKWRLLSSGKYSSFSWVLCVFTLTRNHQSQLGKCKESQEPNSFERSQEWSGKAVWTGRTSAFIFRILHKCWGVKGSILSGWWQGEQIMKTGIAAECSRNSEHTCFTMWRSVLG